MGATDLGPWQPMPLQEATALFAAAEFRWWVAGGNALDLHLQRTWRTHEDTDIGVARTDVTKLADLLDGWDIHIAAAGKLTRWSHGPLSVDLSQNNLWCRPTSTGAWCLDITIGDGDDRHWVYRRDPTITMSWSEAILQSVDRIPYLAPELQLLFKSKTIRPKDTLDATTVIPALEAPRRARLASFLPPDHPWQSIIAGHAPTPTTRERLGP